MANNDCKSAPLICPGDLRLIQCLASCALDGANAANQTVNFYRFDPNSTPTDDVYDDADPVFDPPIEIPATIEDSPDEEELTRFGARSQGWEDNDIEDPDVILYIPVATLDRLGAVLDTENRDEFEVSVNRKVRRYEVIGTHYPKGLGGIELMATIYLIEKG